MSASDGENEETEAFEQQLAELEQQHRATRRGLLEWLDSRLRPEGGDEIERLVGPSNDSEQGEGDAIDLGRIWYSRTRAVTDLLWTKHRWRRPTGSEVAIDIGFDRETAKDARAIGIGPPPERIEPAGLQAVRFLAHSAEESTEPTGDAPDEAKSDAARSEMRLAVSRPPDEAVRQLAARAAALALPTAVSRLPLTRLVSDLPPRLAIRSDRDLVEELTRFVQTIPLSVEPESRLRSPVATLLFRNGDELSKALLLALLLEQRDIQTGLFLSSVEGRVLVGAALPEPFDATAPSVPAESGAELPDDPAVQQLSAWCEAWWGTSPRESEEFPSVWAERDLRPPLGGAGGTAGLRQLYVPITVTGQGSAGRATVRAPESWAFLPLSEPPRAPADRGDEIPEQTESDQEADQHAD